MVRTFMMETVIFTLTLADTCRGEEAGGEGWLGDRAAQAQPCPVLGKHTDEPETPPPRLPVVLRIKVKLILEGPLCQNDMGQLRIDGQRTLAMRAPRSSLKF